MIPEGSEEAFRRYLEVSGLEPAKLNLASGFEQVISFYESVAGEHLQSGADADMLLYQWGTYDWTGSGAMFQVDLTRQFVSAFAEDDDAISQLSLTFYYLPTAATDAFKDGHRWLEDGKSGLSEWCAYVRGSPVFKTFSVVAPRSVELRWEQV